jgi:hypothetical protein
MEEERSGQCLSREALLRPVQKPLRWRLHRHAPINARVDECLFEGARFAPWPSRGVSTLSTLVLGHPALFVTQTGVRNTAASTTTRRCGRLLPTITGPFVLAATASREGADCSSIRVGSLGCNSINSILGGITLSHGATDPRIRCSVIQDAMRSWFEVGGSRIGSHSVLGPEVRRGLLLVRRGSCASLDV